MHAAYLGVVRPNPPELWYNSHIPQPVVSYWLDMTWSELLLCFTQNRTQKQMMTTRTWWRIEIDIAYSIPNPSGFSKMIGSLRPPLWMYSYVRSGSLHSRTRGWQDHTTICKIRTPFSPWIIRCYYTESHLIPAIIQLTWQLWKLFYQPCILLWTLETGSLFMYHNILPSLTTKLFWINVSLNVNEWKSPQRFLRNHAEFPPPCTNTQTIIYEWKGKIKVDDQLHISIHMWSSSSSSPPLL